MQIRKSVVLGWMMVMAPLAFGQIQIGGDDPVETKPTKEKVKIKSVVDTNEYKTSFFVGASVLQTGRSLDFNSNELFAKPFGDREHETGLVKAAVHFGIRQKLNKHLMLEGSVSYYQNGERFSMTQPDTTHIYTTTYNNVGVGLKLYYYYSLNKIDFLVGAGLQPNFRMKYKREDEFIDTDNRKTNTEVKSKDGLSGIGLNFLANAGIQYNFHPRVGVYVMAEYRTDLINLFQKYEPHNQKNFGIGGTLGFAINF